MNLYRRFETDETAEREGVWVDMGDGLKVKVARFNNPAHRKIVESLQKPYRNILRAGGRLPADVQEDIAIRSMAEAILLGWEGVTDEAGAPLAYSAANAAKVLGDLRDFREQVAFLALEAETFRREALEEAGKNSVPASPGTSNGDRTCGSSKTG